MPKLTKNEFIELVKKYQQQIASQEEIEFIEEYYSYFDRADEPSSQFSPEEKELLQNKLSQNILSRIEELEQLPAASGISRKRRFWVNLSNRNIAAAVIMLLILGSGLYLVRDRGTRIGNGSTLETTSRFKNDVSPGADKAVLTLADGTKINLDSVHNGTIGHQGIAKVQKFQTGMLAYHSPNVNVTVQNAPVLYNTVTTPRGGQYQVVLADGTQVWLNAASSLHFPTSFRGRQRIVELTGEAYFEVTHMGSAAEKDKMPFIVKIITPSGSGGEVEVLGTHFNINAYSDESIIKTTLLEGSVKISQAGKNGLLIPGQQAQLNNNGDIKIVPDADVDEAVAWKKGMFQFKKADIKTIMRQVARWYDVDVEYQKNVDEKFYAEISRNTNASNVFKMLEETGAVHFKIEGKKVVVLP